MNATLSARPIDERARVGRTALGQYIEEHRHIVEVGIAAFLERHYMGRLLESVTELARNGKRLRGALAILVCEALGGRPSEAQAAAVAVELAHAASLAHDDILDADVRRRGQPAFHVTHDVIRAVLIPHLVVPHAILSAQPYGPAALHIIIEAWARVVEGQLRDYPPLHSEDYLDPAVEYRAIIDNKTGALFEAAAALGALAANSNRHRSLVRRYGAALGCAFQVADDVTDLRRQIDQPWSMLLEGGGGGGACSMRALRSLIEAAHDEFVTGDAVERAARLALSEVKRCVAYAAGFPSSPQRRLLRQFPAFAVDQIYREASLGD